MSPRPLIIACSLAANVVLGAVWWQRASAVDRFSGIASEGSRASAVVPPAREENAEAAAADWQAIASGSTDEEFVVRLRREGFPPRVVRELVRLRIHEKYAGRLRELSTDSRVIPYWRSRLPPDEGEFERRAKLRALNREMSDELKALLGADAFALPGDHAYENRERTYGLIPADKIAGIEAIIADYGEMSNQVREAMRGVVFPEDREALSYLERERQADLARLLTPDELAEYEKRSSPTATTLRNQLRHFTPTEEEYLAMYEVQRAFDERYGINNLSGEQSDRRRDARPELFAALEAALGSERFEDYRLMTDGNFGGTLSVLESAGLPKERAKDLVRIQQDYNRRAAAVRTDAAISGEQRASRLETMAAEARQEVVGIVGDRNLDMYVARAGTWLRQLSPPAQTVR